VAAFAVLAAGTRLLVMNQSLLARHAWRQTQTAFTIRMFQRHGVDLLRPEVPVFGRPWKLVYELPLFQAVAAGVGSLGTSTETAGRYTAFAFFLLTAVLVRSLGRMLLPGRVGDIAMLVFLACPYGLFWSRAVLPEYPVTAAVLGAILAAARWSARPAGGRRWLVPAVTLLALAAAMKASTAFVWLPLLLAILLVGPHTRPRRDRIAVTTLLVTVTAITAIGWTTWADSVKRASPMTAGAVTGGMIRESIRAWPYLGTPAVWHNPFAAIVGGQIGGWPFVALIVIAVWHRRHDLKIVALVGLVPAAVIAFPVQYGVHDYYSIAVSPAVAIALALALHDVARWAQSKCSVSGAVIAITLGLMWLAFIANTGVRPLKLSFDREHSDVTDTHLLAAEIDRLTKPSDVIGSLGTTWSPDWLYLADRRGVVGGGGGPDSPVLAAWARDNVRWVALGDLPKDARTLDGYRTVEAVGSYLIRLGHRPGDTAPRLTSRDRPTSPRSKPLMARSTSTTELRCDGKSVDVAALTGGAVTVQTRTVGAVSWIQLDGTAPVPVRSWLEFGRPPVGRIGCFGGGSITFGEP
jgi:Dolichyl-phosphate-mannose-protein mannosyltransferase